MLSAKPELGPSISTPVGPNAREPWLSALPRHLAIGDMAVAWKRKWIRSKVLDQVVRVK